MKPKTKMVKISQAIDATKNCLGENGPIEKEAIMMVQDLNGATISEGDAMLASQIARERAKEARRLKMANGGSTK